MLLFLHQKTITVEVPNSYKKEYENKAKLQSVGVFLHPPLIFLSFSRNLEVGVLLPVTGDKLKDS